MISLQPTPDQLQTWAVDEAASEPSQDWELILSWGMEPGRLRVCILNAVATSPKRKFFLWVLSQWVDYEARQSDFEFRRSMCDQWLEAARGIKDRAVKAWRHRARRVFQGQDQFDRETWWAHCFAELAAAEFPDVDSDTGETA